MSGVAKGELDGGGEPLPLIDFVLELLAPRLREGVELGLAARLVLLPLGLDEPLMLQPMERGIQRPLLDLQHVARRRLDALGNRPAVARLGGQRLQNEHVERALNEIGRAHGGIVGTGVIPRRSTMMPRLSTTVPVVRQVRTRPRERTP